MPEQRLVVRFGVFEADLASGELHKGGRHVPLQRKPFDLLAALLDRSGELVSRTELRQRLWPGDVHLDFEHALNATLHKLRRALGDSARAPRYLEVVPGRGVRFLAPVATRAPIAAAGVAALKGWHWSEERTPEALERALRHFDEAVALDPRHPEAHAGRAQTLVLLAEYGLLPPGAALEDARGSALQALARDPALAGARTTLAIVRHRLDRDWPGAEAEYRRALAMDAGDGRALHGYAEFLSQMGRHDAALETIRRARQREPLSSILGAIEGWLLFHARRFAEATGACRDTLEIAPDFAVALFVLGRCQVQSGAHAAALDSLGRAAARTPGVPFIVAGVGYACGVAGDDRGARDALQRLDVLARRREVSDYFRAKVLVGLARHGNALDALEQAVGTAVGWVADLGVDPEWDALRQAARFQALLARLALPTP